jgi:hypothetical protein
VSLGAKREEIVANLYRTKTVSALKLWGRALARLKQDNLAQMVWSVMPATDFEKSGGASADVVGVMDEMMGSIPHTRLALLLIEEPAGASVTVYARTADRHMDLRELLAAYRPAGDRASVTASVMGKPFSTVEREVVDEIRGKLLSVRN